MARPVVTAALAAICLALTPGCSQASEPAERNARTSPSSPVSTDAAGATRARGGAARPAGVRNGSQVLAKTDFTLRGKPACEVRFVYAGRNAEELFWEEPCPAVTTKMLTRRELEAIGKWNRLDGFARKFVNALPGGRVLYVEGSFSASVYPVGTAGTTYEVPVAD